MIMTSPISNESFLQWDAAQVSTFMQSILGNDKSEIGDTFLENNIDGSLLPFITTEHLKEIGITSLHSRLVIKKAINELVVNNHQKHPPKSMHDPEHKLHNININTNYTTMESLKLSMVLVKDMVKKLGVEIHSNNNNSAAANLHTQEEMKRLNDSYTRLKNELTQVVRLVKDSKPLPTPTLDPGPTSFGEAHGYLSYLSYLGEGEQQQQQQQQQQTTNTLSRSNSNGATNTSPTTTVHKDTSVVSPTHSNRFSQGSLLSMGTGKIISQTVPKYNEPKLTTDFNLQKVNIPSSASSSRMDTLRGDNSVAFTRPKLGKTGSSSSAASSPTVTNSGSTATLLGPSSVKQSLQSSGSISGNSVMYPPKSLRQTGSTSQSGNEPLKQLRASTDDSCLKILQHAMKRHHIPREDWSKYVLVICYGDKERILKLAEKPVVVFKELQELGKHPAIMLRQLADTKDEQESGLYNDSRIGSDIPGGML